MKRVLFFMIFWMAGLMATMAQTGGSMYDENYFVQVFKEQDKVKPSYVGIFHREKAAALRQLIIDRAKAWGMKIPANEAEMKALGKDYKPKNDGADVSNSVQQKKVAEIEKQRKDALKQIDAMPDGFADKAALKKQINQNFDKMLAQIPGMYKNARQKLAEDIKENQEKKIDLGDMQVSVETLQSYAGYLDDFASKLTPEQRAELKERVRQLAVGKKLWKEARGFRHGRAAVCSDSGWGFIDYGGNEVVSCKYARVYNFKNQDHTLSEAMIGNKDKDSRMWTTVIVSVKGVGYNAGMVDGNGREVIPCNFIPHDSGYDQIEFKVTPWGEYARVQERASKKHGIIDRNGNYTLPPTYDNIIHWDEERQCFSIFNWETKQRVYINHKGERISK